MPIDPRELANFTAADEVIAFDRPCPKCDYNLRGLRFGGRCPECGHPIQRGRGSTRFADNLTDAPLAYLRTLRAGFGLMALGSLAGVAAFLTLPLAPSEAVRAALYAVVFVASMAWWAGLYLVTAPRPLDRETIPDAILESAALAAASRWGQASWVLAAVALAGAGYASAPFGFGFAVAAAALAFVGLLGLVPLAVRLSSLADWAGDTGLGNRLRTAACGIAFGGTLFAIGQLAGLTGWAPAGVLRLLGMLMFWLAVLGYLLFLVSVLQLAHMAVWAIRNAVNAMETTLRIADRRARHEARIARRTFEAAESLARAAATPPGREVVSRGPNVIPRPEGGSAPYPIE